MRKILALALALALGASLVLGGCADKNQPGTIKDGKELSDVVAAVDARFAERYGEEYKAVAMGMPIDEQYLVDFCAIAPESVREYAGAVSMSMTNSDAFFAVLAQEDHLEAVREALLVRREDLIAQYRQYPVNGSLERAQAGEVYVKGNYVFLIVVGVLDGSSEQAPDFSGDVAMAKDVIDEMFYA
jgi:hypothetical protein